MNNENLEQITEMNSNDNSSSNSIFKNGSTTYYYATKFFSKEKIEQVTDLYAFVRIVDDFVDSIPQNSISYYNFKKEFYEHFKEKKKSKNKIIINFVDLIHKVNIKIEWVDAFFKSMEMDLEHNVYSSFEDTLEYIYGSAEVIGLMMSKILNLDKESYEFAQNLGCAMQYINMIRDFQEDLELQRIYLPISKSNRNDIEMFIKSSEFDIFIRDEINRYFEIQKKAELGFKYISKQYLIPIKTASDMYKWTAKRIYKNPKIILSKKIKPSKFRVFLIGLKNKLLL